MKFGQHLIAAVGILFFLTLGSLAIGYPDLTTAIIGDKVEVRRGDKRLLQVPIHVAKRDGDEAFLAGECLLVRRNVRAQTESESAYYKLEIYRLDGEKQVYSGIESGITPRNILASPDKSWAAAIDEENGQPHGIYLISSDCRINIVNFNGTILYGSGHNGEAVDLTTLKVSNHNFFVRAKFPTPSTIEISDLIIVMRDPQTKKVINKPIKVTITKDGKYRTSDE